MSNKSSNHLFELIKSLNKSEKRYFKLYSSRHTIGEKNNYISLFDYIDKLDIYDETKLFKKFKGESFLNRFSITKNRLYSHILKSLDLFYASSSIEAQLHKSIHSSEILFNKGLYKQAEKILLSAEKQAVKHGKNIILLQIKDRQKQLIEKEMYSDLKKEQLVSFFKDEDRIIIEIGKEQELWNTKSLLFNEINQSGVIRSEKDAKALENIIDRIKDIDIQKSNSKTQHLYHHIYSAYYYTTKNLKKSYAHLYESKTILEKDKCLLDDSPNTYFSTITNLIYIATKLKKYPEAAELLDTLKTIPDSKNYQNTMDLDIKYFSSIYSLDLYLKIEQFDLVGAESLIPEIQSGYQNYGDKINGIRKAYLDFKIAIVYLSLEKYDEALEWINKILNSPGLDKKQDIYCFAQIINLILHFELKNLRFLHYALNSTKRYLKGRDRMFKFEELFLKAITKISKSDLNKFDIEEILHPIEQELCALKDDHYEQIVFEYFDFATWVKSKVEGKSYRELKIAG